MSTLGRRNVSYRHRRRVCIGARRRLCVAIKQNKKKVRRVPGAVRVRRRSEEGARRRLRLQDDGRRAPEVRGRRGAITTQAMAM